MLLTFNGDSLEEFDAKRISENILTMRDSADNQKELTSMLTSYRRQAREAGKGKEFDELVSRINEANPTDELAIRYEYEFSDFSESETPYWDVFNQPTTLLRIQRLEVLASEAKEVGYKSFKKSYDAFQKNLRKLNVRMDGTSFQNPTAFPGQPIELDAGDWRCDSMGVVRETGNGGTEIACIHPIMPVERYVNIDTGEEKIKIAYYNGKYWREAIVSKLNAFDASKVIQLAAIGVSVTTKTAKALSDYLCFIEGKNKDILPEKESVTRLGYIGNGDNFSPYVDDITFDGDANYQAIYNAISCCGNYDTWLRTARECASCHITAKIMLAASFASVLVGKIGCLPFFVHLWGVESGTGKTVALMLAASVWGDPQVGQYIQTFNSTQVGLEKTAAFLNNIPLCIDELQLSKDSHGKSKFDVYQLAQGVGRTRGTKSGGIDRTPTWRLCVLTTGETPIVNDNSGAGAMNRVIDVECKASSAVIKNGFEVSSVIKNNYGYAGQEFIRALTPDVIKEAEERYTELLRLFTNSHTTEKQSMAAAMIILGSELADRYILRTGKPLTPSDLERYLKTTSSVSAGERAYSFMCDWVGSHSNNFKRGETSGQGYENYDNKGEIYGIIEGGYAYINNSIFRKVVSDEGFDARATISWLKAKGLILTRAKNNTRGKRINGVNVECVAMLLKCEENELDEYVDIL